MRTLWLATQRHASHLFRRLSLRTGGSGSGSGSIGSGVWDLSDINIMPSSDCTLLGIAAKALVLYSLTSSHTASSVLSSVRVGSGGSSSSDGSVSRGCRVAVGDGESVSESLEANAFSMSLLYDIQDSRASCFPAERDEVERCILATSRVVSEKLGADRWSISNRKLQLSRL